MSTNLTPGQIAKLPNYVRQEIERLAADVVGLRKRLSAGPEDSTAFLDPFGKSPTPLGSSPMISFGPKGEPEFHVCYVNGELKIQGIARTYSDRFAVLPVSGNYVTTKHVKDED